MSTFRLRASKCLIDQNGCNRVVRWLVFGMIVATPSGVAADPYSDTFQPDFFGTKGALAKRTDGLRDPGGRLCTLPAEPLTLAVAIDLALCRNPTTRVAWAAAREQAAALGRAEGGWLPNISGSGNVERTVGPHQDANGEVTTIDQTTKDAALNLTWTLYDFGARRARVQSASRLLDAAAFTVRSASQQTSLNVIQSYYGVVAADALLAGATTNEATAQHSLDIARALRERGLESLADVLQAETAYDQAVLDRVQAAQTTRISRGSLAVAVGSDADQPLKLAAEPVPAQVPALTARMEDLMAEAARQRPDLAAARAQRDAAIADISLARSTGLPTISIGAGRTMVKQTDVPTQNYGQVGINVSIPLFTGFADAYGVRQAQATLESREASAEQIRLEITLDVWNAYYALSSAIEQLSTTSTLMTTAQNNEDVAQGRYQAGIGTIIDLLTAQTAAASARKLRISAELDWQLSRARLAFALGKLTTAEPLADDMLP